MSRRRKLGAAPLGNDDLAAMPGDDEAGESVPFEEDDDDVVDTPDGGAIVRLVDDDEDEEAEDNEFYANLVEGDDPVISDTASSRIAAQLVDLIGKDKEARSKRDKQYEEGIRRTGLGDDAPGGAQFQGASKVVHPMLTEACVDFAARSMKELYPPSGPAKMMIPGKYTDERVAKSKRKAALLNYQMTVACPEFRAEIEQTMTQVPLGGSQYTKYDWDKPRNRPRPQFVAIDDMLLPYAAANFYSSQRKTHVQYLTQIEYEQRIKEGMYRDVDLSPVGMTPEQTASGEATDKIEGREQSSYNEDGLRTIFECHVTMEIEDVEEGYLPYIVTIDKTTTRVLAIYRNWDEDDDSHEELQWFVEWPFVPWRGAYAIGLPHMIGGLAAASTGALRALMDSAHTNNTPGMLKLKGARMGGQTQSVTPGTIQEIEGALNVDDIRKLAMPMPYNQPSPVLFQLLGFLVEAGRSVVRTTLDDIADSNENVPVGTTLARIEQAMVVYSAIHERLHESMARTLRILARLNGKNLDDSKLDQEVGEELATRADFQGPCDVVPVSDPNIYSEAQRFAQTQAVSQRAQLVPQLYNARKVEELILRTLKIPGYDDLLVPAIEPKDQNAVNENVTATMGKPVTAFPDQDHLAHLQAHLSYLTSPMFGSSDLMAPTFIPGMINHIKEHMAWWYASEVFRITTEIIGEDVGEMLKAITDEEDDKSRRVLDKMLAEAGTIAVEEGQKQFESLPQVIQHAQQIMQKFQQPQQQDPMVAVEEKKVAVAGQKVQIEAQKAQQQAANDQQELQQQGASDQQQGALDAAKLQQQAASDQRDTQMGAAKLQQEAQARAAEDALKRLALGQDAAEAQADEAGDMQRTLAEIAAREAMNREDNQTALVIADAEIAQDGNTNLNTGTGINP